MGLLGIVCALGLLMWLSFRGWSVLVLAPLAALLACAFSGEPLLAHWTLTFMAGAAGFIAQYFPLFLVGAIFGKLMDDSGAVQTIAAAMTDWLGARRAIVAIVLAGALLTYGGVSLFVAFFVLAPMGHALFQAAGVPARLMPAAIALGTSTFTMSALPGTPAIQNAIPMPFLGTTAFAAPGLGLLASAVMLGCGLWWLTAQERRARARGEAYAPRTPFGSGASAALVRERGSTAAHFDPAEMHQGARHAGAAGRSRRALALAVAPLGSVVLLNLLGGLVLLPRADLAYLAAPRFGATAAHEVAGVWSVLLGLLAGIAVVWGLFRRRLEDVRATVDAGANAAVLPVLSVASLVGFGSVVAALPSFALVRDWIVTLDGGPLVSIALATNLLAALTGSASGGLTIALEALGSGYLQMAQAAGLDPALIHRVAVIGAGTLDSLPHNGAVVSLLAVCGCSHRESYRDIVVVSIVGALLGLLVVLLLGSLFGSF